MDLSFLSCKDCRIIDHPSYKEVRRCQACRDRIANREKWADSLPLQDFIREVVNDRLAVRDSRINYDKLYEMYWQEMPYGTAKARDGDPDEWITDRLHEEFAHLIEEEVV